MTKKIPKNILVVEDDTLLNDAYKMILESNGHATRTAYDGKEALKLVKEQEPDIIFLDLRMPVMDGIEFLKEYQPQKNHKHVKVIVFSNYDMQQEVDQAYALGAERYVLKAWASPKELLKLVEDIEVSR
ncbi:MAG TPA: response regulator [Candidatus Saccharimonadales bacterium]|jgi:CheY-like chemotaxis protein|nr:response regulator [Candidatus Saccharimonadales bacterium]